MPKHERFIINIKTIVNNKVKNTDILAYSYRDAINYAKLIDASNVDIRIYSDDERLVYSKSNIQYQNHNPQGQQLHQSHILHQYHHNLVTGESYEEIHEIHEESDDDDSYA
jgi:hypothetical protein